VQIFAGFGGKGAVISMSFVLSRPMVFVTPGAKKIDLGWYANKAKSMVTLQDLAELTGFGGIDLRIGDWPAISTKGPGLRCPSC
jgi:hypothetical protein